MDVIDGNWIKQRLPKTRGSKADFARAMGLEGHHVAKLLSGERRVQAHEIPKILSYFGETLGMKEDSAAFTRTNFAEPVRQTDRLLAVARATCPRASHPFYYRAKRSEPLAAILRGDLLILIHGEATEPGQLVLISSEGEQGEGRNELRRYLPPVLATLDLTDEQPSLPADSPGIGVIGHVKAVLRSADFSQEQDR